MNKPSRYERLHGKRPANKYKRILHMRERIIARMEKETERRKKVDNS